MSAEQSRRDDEQLIEMLLPARIPRPAPQPAPVVPLPTPAADEAITCVLATASLDTSGRVSARSVLPALGWPDGHHLRIDTRHGRLIVTADPDGRHTVSARGEIPLPAPLRRLCAITPDTPVLLAALPEAAVLIVHRIDTIAALLAGTHRQILGDLREP